MQNVTPDMKGSMKEFAAPKEAHAADDWSTTHLDDFGIEVSFQLCLVQDGLFDGPRADQDENEHVPLLANAVRTVLCLQENMPCALGQPVCVAMPLLDTTSGLPDGGSSDKN